MFQTEVVLAETVCVLSRSLGFSPPFSCVCVGGGGQGGDACKCVWACGALLCLPFDKETAPVCAISMAFLKQG